MISSIVLALGLATSPVSITETTTVDSPVMHEEAAKKRGVRIAKKRGVRIAKKRGVRIAKKRGVRILDTETLLNK